MVVPGAVRLASAKYGLVLPAGLLLAPCAANADVSSWLAVGGGESVLHNHGTGTQRSAALMTYSIGVGSSPASNVVIGGLLRGTTFFDLGTDVGLAARACTGGFARGEWGVALDVGGSWRPWLADGYGQWPVQALVTGGAPWGLQLAVGGDVASLSGEAPARGIFAMLEIDLLRLTVMRQGESERWWFNPAPAGGHLIRSPDGSSPESP